MWQSESTRRIINLGAVVVATAVAVPATSASAQETYELSGDPAAVWNLAGAVSVTGGGSALTVEVRRAGADAGQLQVATGSIDLDSDGVGRVDALRILYPGDEIVHPGGNTELHVRDDGTFYRGGDKGRKVKIREDGSGLDAHAVGHGRERHRRRRDHASRRHRDPHPVRPGFDAGGDPRR